MCSTVIGCTVVFEQYEWVYPTEMTRKKKLDEQIDKDKVAQLQVPMLSAK